MEAHSDVSYTLLHTLISMRNMLDEEIEKLSRKQVEMAEKRLQERE